MESPDTIIHSFIIKIFVEEAAAGDSRLAWHGYITNVSTNERIYIKNFSDIRTFISPFLKNNNGVQKPVQDENQSTGEF